MRGRLATPTGWQCDRNPLINTDLGRGAPVKFNWAQAFDFTPRVLLILGGVTVQRVRQRLRWPMPSFAQRAFSDLQ